MILVRAPVGAPMPACGDTLILTMNDCYDADFEVTEVARESGGWWIGCERKRRAPTSSED